MDQEVVPSALAAPAPIASACTGVGAAIAAALLSTAFVSDSQATAEPWPSTAAEMQKLLYSPWAKFCGKGDAPFAKEVCFTGADARTETGQPFVAVALIEQEGEAKKVLRVTLPSTLRVRYGTRIVIDKEAPINSTSFTCFTNGCMSDYEAPPELVDKLKKGRTLELQAINLAGTVIAVPLPLAYLSGNSFAGANEGPPADPKVFEAKQGNRCDETPRPHFSTCAPDDRKCEVASKLGCIFRDDLLRKRLPTKP